MAYGPITSWQIEMENVETVIDFIFSGSKVTIDGDFIHKIKGYLLLERKIMTVLDSILKIIKNQRHHFPNSGPYSQNFGFFQ